MRGYKRPLSVLHVSCLIAAMGSALDAPASPSAEGIT